MSPVQRLTFSVARRRAVVEATSYRALPSLALSIEPHFRRSQNLGAFDALYRASRQPPPERRTKTP
jgi:hypothetical protein